MTYRNYIIFTIHRVNLTSMHCVSEGHKNWWDHVFRVAHSQSSSFCIGEPVRVCNSTV